MNLNAGAPAPSVSAILFPANELLYCSHCGAYQIVVTRAGTVSCGLCYEPVKPVCNASDTQVISASA